MWFRTKTEALLAAMRMIDRNVDPDELVRRARDMAVRLPIESQMVSATYLNGTHLAHRIEYHRLRELTSAIDTVLGGKKKAAA